MHTSLKPFLISLGTGIGIILLLLFTNGLGFEKEVFLSQHLIKRILIGSIWLILGLLRNTKDHNTKLLKKILLIGELYLFLLIFVQPGSNFSQGEFLIFYLSLVGITHEATTPTLHKGKKIFLTLFFGIVGIFMISIASLMRYRVPISQKHFIQNQSYHLYLLLNGNLSPRYTTISLQSPGKIKTISTQSGFQSYILEKNTEFSLLFSSQENDEKNYLLIQDPEGNLLQIFPQTKTNFSTRDSKLTFNSELGNTSFYEFTTTFPSPLLPFQEKYFEAQKKEVLNTLPSRGRTNQKFQKRSITYTKVLAKILPFRYQKNREISKSYFPYFDLSTGLPSDTTQQNLKSLFKTTTKIGTEKTEGGKKYREYLQKLF